MKKLKELKKLVLRKVFIFLFNLLQKDIYATNVIKGFWDEKRNDGEMLALIHSEVSECLEALRNGNPPDSKIKNISSAESELADIIIRILDMAGGRSWNIAEALIAKAEYNKTRPYKHNKAF